MAKSWRETMYRLKRLILKDFMSFKDLEINFTRRGVYLIQGHNLKGGDSNGAGKTAILSGIVWTLFGRTQAGLQGKDVVRWGEKSCTGILTISDGTHTYEIIRGTEELEFRIDGNIQAGHKRDVQETINNTFSTDYTLFTTFNIFTRTWSKFFTEVGDADKKKLFKNILRMNKIDEAYDKSKKIYAGLTFQTSKMEAVIDQLNVTIPEQEKELKALIDYKNNEKQIKLDAITDVEYKRETFKPEIVDVDGEMIEIQSKLDLNVVQKLNEALDFCNIKLSNIGGLIYSEEDALVQKDAEIQAFSATGGACPRCGQGIPPRHRQAYRRQLEIIRKEMFTSYQDSIKEKEAINTEIYEIEEKLRTIAGYQNRYKELEMLQWKNKVDLERYESYCKTANDVIAKLLETKDETINSYDELIGITETKLNKSKGDLKIQQDVFDLLKKEIDLYSYIMWLYSRQGIVSILVEKCFGRLKYLANKYLLKISTEGFKIDITPQKALKSGEIREEIDLYILDGDKKIPYTSLSSGQQQRINTAMLFAMYTWGREIGASNFDFILLDEIMDLSLGLKGQEDTLEMIYFFRPMIYHILLITHKEALTGRFDKEIEVIRGNEGISKISI